jgi:hypothetical protein
MPADPLSDHQPFPSMLRRQKEITKRHPRRRKKSRPTEALRPAESTLVQSGLIGNVFREDFVLNSSDRENHTLAQDKCLAAENIYEKEGDF